MTLQLYDTLQRAKRPFEPREPGAASIYLCGPTVQADAHVGHGRAAVVFDVMRRWLIHSGLDVLFVRNITDIDDKIILRARRERIAPAIIAQRYSVAYNDALGALGILSPDIEPRATGHIIEMHELIQQLLDQDKAYVADGNVLFRVRTFGDYGKLSGRRIDDMQQGDDIVGSDVKEDPLDFAMWKAAKPNEPSWPSPWGPGRPGWHIECSAMAGKHLGTAFDIHAGGLDLVFPHHENEIAQFEAAHGHTFARYWVHNGMVQMGEEKMSKSIGNVIALHDAVERWGRGPLRLWYLSAHHRSPLVFSSDRLEEARSAYERLATFVRTAQLVTADPIAGTGPEVEPDRAAAERHANAFAEAMDDDLNAPLAVAALHDLVSDGHDQLKKAEAGDETAAAAVAGMTETILSLADDVLGLDLQGTVDAGWDEARRIAPLVAARLRDRQAAREDKDFAAADAIRDELQAAGVVLEDRAGGTRWYVGQQPPS